MRTSGNLTRKPATKIYLCDKRPTKVYKARKWINHVGIVWLSTRGKPTKNSWVCLIRHYKRLRKRRPQKLRLTKSKQKSLIKWNQLLVRRHARLLWKWKPTDKFESLWIFPISIGVAGGEKVSIYYFHARSCDREKKSCRTGWRGIFGFSRLQMKKT